MALEGGMKDMEEPKFLTRCLEKGVQQTKKHQGDYWEVGTS